MQKNLGGLNFADFKAATIPFSTLLADPESPEGVQFCRRFDSYSSGIVIKTGSLYVVKIRGSIFHQHEKVGRKFGWLTRLWV